MLSGGGTLGPVVPLLAIREAYQKAHPEAQFVWVGTHDGPERKLVEAVGIPFLTISSGKWRRYFSLQNIIDIFRIKIGFFQSLFILRREKPDLLISGGGFVSVPLHWAGWFLGIPSWVHQQDVRPGLANRLMFPAATKITTALQESAEHLPARKTEWLGNPVRDLSVSDAALSRKKFSIPADAPVIFVLGGGTGSASINHLVVETLPFLPLEWHVIHLTGMTRPDDQTQETCKKFSHYHSFHFFSEEMKDAYAAADIVVARAGFGTLSELAAIKKPAVIIPLPNSHQEENARFFNEHKGVVALTHEETIPTKLSATLKDLLTDLPKRLELVMKLNILLPTAQPERIIAIINKLISK
ncbi:MAG: hypothetical protein A3I29_00080 [Candidatus Magasanikbacteria bacterium RIFCSPLOWO2_02_FULL_44_11]|uniref:UDP-N-acetylglucosamine--N-acetylmuramyl-(pentapeptide) pyrophosphoryl-undecaprenol N-acetylglucosamine transferase n=2 Tax=Candidatus Magasanikiibacteriota TaxID=1752731 RepID=A0A1F6NBR2_9BACT|nr:MAG: hypothetical protein A3D53_01755 [Candidatus Magasanikbacteria bacterium RIFCSPHIGHO2_02_FULL_45_10]OGH81365.1 MAG: hypothetical protein A3I29_00080 [Candidatus Magasanikbacteria bacterium RIFCSPLOWO2_02_FULL_44_11]